MNLFSRNKGNQPPPEASLPSRILEERVHGLESLVRQLDADLNDLWDRFQRLQGRRAKREALDNPKAPEAGQDRVEQLNARIKAQRSGNPFAPRNGH